MLSRVTAALIDKRIHFTMVRRFRPATPGVEHLYP
jgi:hypothetical protein